MYLPRQFDHRDPAVTCRLLREHPLASLISTDDQGFPFVSHLPIKLDATGADGMPGVLLGHLARANPQVQHLAQHLKQERLAGHRPQPQWAQVFAGTTNRPKQPVPKRSKPTWIF